MIWDVQGVIIALVALGRHEAALELEGIHAAVAHDCGTAASPTDEWRERLERALATAHTDLGKAASEDRPRQSDSGPGARDAHRRPRRRRDGSGRRAWRERRV